MFNATLHAHDLLETARLFAGAKVVIGAVGGGLGNMVFCAPATAVVELRGKAARPTVHHVYMATNLGLRYYGIEMDSWSVSVEDLIRIVRLYA